MKKIIYIGITTIFVCSIHLLGFSQGQMGLNYPWQYVGLNIGSTEVEKLMELPRLDSVYAVDNGANYRHYFEYDEDGLVTATKTDYFDTDLNIWITIAIQEINYTSDSIYTINSIRTSYSSGPLGISYNQSNNFYERGDSLINDTIICYSNYYRIDTITNEQTPNICYNKKYYNGLLVETNDYFNEGPGIFISTNKRTFEYNDQNKVTRTVSEGYNSFGSSEQMDTMHYIQTTTYEYSIDPNDSNISIEYVESYSIQAFLVSGDTTYMDWNYTNRINNTTHIINQTFVNNITGAISTSLMNSETKFYNDDNTIDREVTYSIDSRDDLYESSTIQYVYNNNGFLTNILTLGSEYQSYPIIYTEDFDCDYSGNLVHYTKERNATSQIISETTYYLGIPSAQEISITDFQTITVTFNKELDNTVQIMNYLEIISTSANVLTILSATISPTDPNQLIIQLNRPIEYGDNFELFTTEEIPLTDGRTVSLYLESKSLNDGTEITSPSSQKTTEISVLQFVDRIEVQGSEDINKVEVITANGTKISEYKGNKIVVISTDKLASGVYLLKITDYRSTIKNTKILVNK